MKTTVLVLGGGVAGLSAAHELMERGFSVTVYEKSHTLGGKSRSYRVIVEPNEALSEQTRRRLDDILDLLAKKGVIERRPEGRRKGADYRIDPENEALVRTVAAADGLAAPELPGEHGFRLFPAFYKHLPDTMSRIPCDASSWKRKTVLDNLVPGSRVLIAREEPPISLDLPLRFRSPAELASFLRTGIPTSEIPLVVAKLAALLSSSETRWNDEYESRTWWDFIEADGKSAAYQKFLGEIGVRWFAAMDPRHASTRTIGKIGLQLWKDFLFGVVGGSPPRQKLDQFLNGPTNEVWFDPWQRYLISQGVKFELGREVTAIDCNAGGKVERVVFADGTEARADYYVCTLPIGPFCSVLEKSESLRAADPAFSRIPYLKMCEGWMVGVQFYLKKNIPITPGGLIFGDAPWALTGVSQTQFWKPEFRKLLNGDVAGVLSIIVSDWDTPGDFLRKPARACSADELKAEVWNEIKAHLNHRGVTYPLDEEVITDGDLVAWHASVPWDAQAGVWRNEEKLLLNKTGSWKHRPEAVTKVRNFFLAADYVRTYTDLATMEGANEAARRAVNGILDECRSPEARCELWPLELDLPGPFETARKAAAFADLLRLRGTELLGNMRSFLSKP